MGSVFDAIAGRRSIRKYEDRQILKEELDTILKAGMLAPSASNRQPWHFVVMQDRDLIEEVNDAILDAMQKRGGAYAATAAKKPDYAPLFHAPTVILVCGVKDNRWSYGDCGLAAQNMALAAHELGIGSCMVGFIRSILDEEAYAPVVSKLQIPEGYELHYAFTFGYPMESPDARKRDFDKVTYL
ncbi:MAG: nitroreductase family protein [Clostridiales bacterium]|nr:nitroreductase family protein [Clostridiales bacterium]